MGWAGQRAAATAVAIFCALSAAPAHAEEAQLQEATRLVGEAEFERALALLDEVSEAEELTREELLRLLELRALVQHALGNERQIDQELIQLAALSPNHQFGAAVPPALQERFSEVSREVGTPLTLDVQARRIRGGFQIEAEVTGEAERLVRQTVISARIPGGEWVRTEGRRASIPARGESAVEYFAAAIGPGGVVMLEEGSEDEPRLIGTPESEGGTNDRVRRSIRDAAQGQPGGDEPIVEPPRRTSPWVWVGVSVGVLAVAGGVLAAILLTRDAQNTQLGSPEVSWP